MSDPSGFKAIDQSVDTDVSGDPGLESDVFFAEKLEKIKQMFDMTLWMEPVLAKRKAERAANGGRRPRKKPAAVKPPV